MAVEPVLEGRNHSPAERLGARAGSRGDGQQRPAAHDHSRHHATVFSVMDSLLFGSGLGSRL